MVRSVLEIYSVLLMIYFILSYSPSLKCLNQSEENSFAARD